MPLAAFAAAPPLSGVLTAATDGCGKVLLTWPNVQWPLPLATGTPALKSYRIYRDGVPIAEGQATPLWEYSRNRNQVVSGLAADRQYAFGVTAIDTAGNESLPLTARVTTPTASSVSCRDTDAPLAPTLAVVPGEASARACSRLASFTLSAVDPEVAGRTSSGIDHFNVYRDGRFIARSAGQYKQYVGLYPGNTYHFTATASDRAGNESPMSSQLVHQVPADCQLGKIFPQSVRLLVLPVRPSGGPPDPFPVADVYDFVQGGSSFPSHSVKDFVAEVSFGREKLAITAASAAWIKLPWPVEWYCSTNAGGGWWSGCNHDKLLEHALAATGRQQSDFDVFLFVKNGMSDQNSGTTSSGGVYSSVHVNGVGIGRVVNAYRRTLHELSHVIGGSVEHSGGAWLCPGQSAGTGFSEMGGFDINDPNFGCNTVDDEGDAYSVLGSSALSAYHIPMLDKWLKGYLSPAQTVVAPEGASDLVLFPAEGGGTPDAVRQVIVPYRLCSGARAESPFFSLEYRTPTGFDVDPMHASSSANPPVDGVQIRLAPPIGVERGPTESLYLGTLTSTGTTMFSYRGRTVQLLQSDGHSAKVRVTRPHCPPQLPIGGPPPSVQR
jgi:hypothetical protein